ncbi:MAG: hypothetical protein O2856_08900 [Planctomycetota bacterium]|nr:hypothetical protein [Planctomycetota bacterium]
MQHIEFLNDPDGRRHVWQITNWSAAVQIALVFHLLIALAGLGIAIMYHDRLIAIACLLPGITWSGSCMILGTTGQYLTDALQASEPKFQSLIRRGILHAIEIAEKPDEAGAPDTEIESPLPSDKKSTETGS